MVCLWSVCGLSKRYPAWPSLDARWRERGALAVGFLSGLPHQGRTGVGPPLLRAFRLERSDHDFGPVVGGEVEDVTKQVEGHSGPIGKFALVESSEVHGPEEQHR